jgi:hypothetical protein
MAAGRACRQYTRRLSALSARSTGASIDTPDCDFIDFD